MVPEDGDERGQKLADEVEQPVEAESSSPEAEAPEAEAAGSDERLAELELELEETKNRMLRIAADFENFRRRARRDAEEAQHRGREEVLKELLVVFDNLDRAVEAAGTHEAGPAAKAILEGVEMVQKQFTEGLARFGLKPFKALGKPFDPNFHEAMAQVDSNEHPPGTVVQEYQKGYMLGERLLRPSMVVVSSPNSKPASEDTSEGVPEDEAEATIEVSMSDLPKPDSEEGSA